MRDNLHTVVFAAALAVVCSLLLAATSRFTTPFREANEKAEEMRNFLEALEVPFEPGTGAKALVEVFEQNVRVNEGAGITIYAYVPDGGADTAPRSLAVPFSGPGLWGPVNGVMALEPDLLTIRAVRFYKQEETPGLGGEIGSDWFQDQFKGKRIVSADGTPGIRIAPGAGAESDHAVDAVTGATMTCDRVQDMLNGLANRIAQQREQR